MTGASLELVQSLEKENFRPVSSIPIVSRIVDSLDFLPGPLGIRLKLKKEMLKRFGGSWFPGPALRARSICLQLPLPEIPLGAGLG